MKEEFQNQLALQILEIVAPAGIEPLENWVTIWPRDQNQQEFEEVLSFPPLGSPASVGSLLKASVMVFLGVLSRIQPLS
jgi:hypothetical protein